MSGGRTIRRGSLLACSTRPVILPITQRGNPCAPCVVMAIIWQRPTTPAPSTPSGIIRVAEDEEGVEGAASDNACPLHTLLVLRHPDDAGGDILIDGD